MSSHDSTIHDDAMLPPIPLTLAEAGQRVRIAAISGGCGAAEHLADLGLLRGAELQVVRPSTGGPVLIAHKGARFALGRRLANKIVVYQFPAGAPERSPDNAVPLTA
jgi:ferrous iron transport protein A